MRRSGRLQCRGRAIVGWGIVCLVAAQLLLTLFLETRHPEVFDPEYRDRLHLLRQRTTEDPGRPLLLVIGSSRLMTDFRPELLAPLDTPAGEQPLPFNFCHTGAGPLLNLMEVRRLLQQGYHPRWLVIEVLPALLGASGESSAVSLAAGGDLPLLRRYVGPWKLGCRYAWERLRACFSRGAAGVRYCLPWQASDSTCLPLEPLGGPTCGYESPMDADEVRRRTAVVRAQYFPGLQQLRVATTPDRAMRELLDLCHQEGIETVLLLAPESSEFRGWYPPESAGALARYVNELSLTYHVPIIDARAWLADADFTDGHHASARGAVEFTLRLGRSVLRPLVEGKFRQETAALAGASDCR